MFEIESLESLIRRYIFLGPISSKGFEIVKCVICNDYKIRGGFKFDNDSIFYSCFNCGCKAGYKSITKHHIDNKFKDVLLAFGIPEIDISRSVSFNFFKDKKDNIPIDSKVVNNEFPSKIIKLPSESVLVSSNLSPWCEVAIEYLESRCLNIKDIDCYVTENISYVGRLLIPYFLRGKIIYWQGRSMDDETIYPRYKNPSVEKNNIFFNMDELYRYTKDPIFVTEGPLDAISIGKNAIALTGSTLTDFKISELEKVAKNRKVIFVIDKNENGYKLGNEILDIKNLNFYISMFPNNIEDSNDALKEYGRLWISTYLVSNAYNNLSGKVYLKLNCKNRNF